MISKPQYGNNIDGELFICHFSVADSLLSKRLLTKQQCPHCAISRHHHAHLQTPNLSLAVLCSWTSLGA